MSVLLARDDDAINTQVVVQPPWWFGLISLKDKRPAQLTPEDSGQAAATLRFRSLLYTLGLLLKAKILY